MEFTRDKRFSKIIWMTFLGVCFLILVHNFNGELLELLILTFDDQLL